MEQFRAEKVCGGCEAWARRCEVVPEIVDPNSNEDPNASDMNNEETTISTTTEFSPVSNKNFSYHYNEKTPRKRRYDHTQKN